MVETLVLTVDLMGGCIDTGTDIVEIFVSHTLLDIL
tara:strand:+ start:432 stop:539 length:108 start_codon:yes stop_codon:yes gene_type:complete